MDDVGQTLLNWAAAFGTPEMIEYLCAKGADVNRGHYLMIQLIMNQLTI
jgi:E3 ubiquitin-protein ligase HECTD1